MKQMQIYVSMPSFNISESKDWHGTRALLDPVHVCVCGGCQWARALLEMFEHGCACNLESRLCVSV